MLKESVKSNRACKKKHTRQESKLVGFNRRGAASIYSHQGGISSIRKWLDDLQAALFLSTKQKPCKAT